MVRIMKHYHFKFGKANEIFKDLIDKEKIPLSIYFWPEGVNGKDSYLSNPKTKKPSKDQVHAFYDVEKNPTEACFWIFNDGEIFCYQPENGNIFDGEKNNPFLIREENGIKYHPKSMYVVRKQKYKKFELPEIFANINSNRHYNQVTIAELKNAEEKIADYLINEENNNNNPRIQITKHNYLNFLSPIEFETLIFLIFNYGDSYCSSFRGSTLEGKDLKVRLSKFKELTLPDDWYWIQAKKKNYDEPPNLNEILIHRGKENIEKRILGENWLIECIDNRQDIKNWLKNMTFSNKMFDFIWYQ
jgi:hypothetical protein